MANEIDYSEIPQPPATTLPSGWKAPRHVYFGKKDPQTGQMEDEPTYVHQEYPRMLYAKREGRVVARVVNSAGERNALGDGWETTPAKFGILTAPSFDELLAMRDAEQAQPEDAPRRGPGRPPKG